VDWSNPFSPGSSGFRSMSKFRVVAAGASCGLVGFCAGAAVVSRPGAFSADGGAQREGASSQLSGIRGVAHRAEFGVARCEKGEGVKWPAQVSLESLRVTQVRPAPSLCLPQDYRASRS